MCKESLVTLFLWILTCHSEKYCLKCIVLYIRYVKMREPFNSCYNMYLQLIVLYLVDRILEHHNTISWI